LIDRYRLPIQFNPAPLHADLARVLPDEWTPHFNSGYHDGGWSGVALRAQRGETSEIYPNPTAQEIWSDTPVLARCPAFRNVLDSFRCPLSSVRLLRLEPGCRIREHRDYNLGLEDGELRVHVPITTNPDVEFVLAGERVEMREGECWYLDFNQPHRVVNLGASPRVHLVIDGMVDRWILSLFPSDVATSVSGPSPNGRANVNLFFQYARSNPPLLRKAQSAAELDGFATFVVRMGRELGYRFTIGDLAEELPASKLLDMYDHNI
jgi:quercetin dioxygenase-like cupin family protein